MNFYEFNLRPILATSSVCIDLVLYFGKSLELFSDSENMDENRPCTHFFFPCVGAFRNMGEVSYCFLESYVKFEGDTGCKIYMDFIWD